MSYSLPAFVSAVRDLFVRQIRRWPGQPLDADLEPVATAIRQSQRLAALHGVRDALRSAQQAAQGGSGIGPWEAGSVLPEELEVARVPFREAVADLVSRTPRWSRRLQDAQAVAQLYRQQHAFALARSTSRQLTRYAQDTIRSGLARGEAPADTMRALRRLPEALGERTPEGWTRAYAEMAYRTNVQTARQRGRLLKASQPEIRRWLPGLVYRAVMDRDTRPSHRLLHGLTAPVSWSGWLTFAPPAGYNCRCSLQPVGGVDLREAFAALGIRPHTWAEPLIMRGSWQVWEPPRDLVDKNFRDRRP